MKNTSDSESAGARRTPTIADRYADLLDILRPDKRRAMVVRLSIGFYEGWHPSRSEIADLVAVETGLLTVDESLHRQRLRNNGNHPTDISHAVLANPPVGSTK